MRTAGANTTTVYTPNAYYERTVSGSATTTRSYYYAGGDRIGLRVVDVGGDRLRFLLADHLGSLSVVTGQYGGELARQGFYPYGGERYEQTADPNAYTAYDFTGQRLDDTGLHFFRARYYHSAIGRFVSADTLVPEPGNPQSLNRYSYGLNNPIRYTDPSGHWVETAWDIANIAWDIYEVRQDPSWLNIGALAVDVGATVLPLVPAGVGMVVRGGKAAKAAAEVASHADEVADAARLINRFDDATDAVSAARRLAGVGAHSDEASSLIQTIARQSTRGSGNRVVIGKWIEGGGYIAEAQKHGGIYYATDPEVWRALGGDAELAWKANEQFLRNQLEAGISRIDLAGESVEDVLQNAAGSFRWREVMFLLSEAGKYGYVRIGNSWIKAVP